MDWSLNGQTVPQLCPKTHVRRANGVKRVGKVFRRHNLRAAVGRKRQQRGPYRQRRGNPRCQPEQRSPKPPRACVAGHPVVR
jgi:hypothetical protein